MTNEERITVSIYTGVLMCDFDSLHKRIEELLGRPVWTHELADKKLVEELKEKVKPDFMKLCEGSTNNLANTPTTPASVAARLTDEEIERIAQMIEDSDTVGQDVKIVAVLRDYVRMRRLMSEVKRIVKDKDAVDAKANDGFIVTAVGAVEQIKRLLAEAEKGETK